MSAGHRLAAVLGRFAACRRAIAAMEFALLMPGMLLVVYATAEFGNALLLDRKLTRAAHTGADIVAQARNITAAELDDVMTAMREVIRPFPAVDVRIQLTQVWRDIDSNTVRVDWGVAYNTGALGTGTAFELPENLVPQTGSSVIVVDISYDYRPLFGDAVTGTLTIDERAYLRPRRTTRVTRL